MNPRTQALLAADFAHVWHPFTQMQTWPDDEPLVIERAEGNWLIDTEGRRWLDAISSLWVNVHGHRKAEIDAAIVEQLGNIAHGTLLGQASVPSIELAKALVRIAPPGLTRVFYSDSGSSAVEVAVKMAYQYWQLTGRASKRRLVALGEAYHGDTVGAVSVGGIALFHERFRDLLFSALRIPCPHTGPRNPSAADASLEALRALFTNQADDIAALVVEPLVQGAAGMLLQPKGWLKEVERLCRAHDVLLICDEVATGFGRTGTMFAVEQEGVTPDVMAIAKGLTAGYLPLSATLTSERVYEAFRGSYASARTFFHGHSYAGNALACAAALANLRLFESESVLTRMRPTLAALTEGLARVAKLPHVGEVRQCGMMVGIELVADRATGAEYPFEARKGFEVCLAARSRQVLLRPLGNVVVLMPPLSLSVDEARLLTSAVEEAIVEKT